MHFAPNAGPDAPALAPDVAVADAEFVNALGVVDGQMVSACA